MFQKLPWLVLTSFNLVFNPFKWLQPVLNGFNRFVLDFLQVSIAAHRQHSSPENNGRTNVHMMVLHLTIADLVIQKG